MMAALTVFLLATALPESASAQQSDSGLRCRLSEGSPMVAGLLECTVVVDDLTIYKVTFNRGNCLARFDDARAERAYYEFWGDTPENRDWWERTDYHRRYRFGSRVRVEASGTCSGDTILEYEIDTNRGSYTWTVSR
jgi:hypothetical protein